MAKICQYSVAMRWNGRCRVSIRFSEDCDANRDGICARFCDKYVAIPYPFYALTSSLTSVSAGFDAAAGDELGGCEVTPAGYAHMTYMLSSLAGGKVVVALEVETILMVVV